MNETIYYECNEENYKFILNELQNSQKQIGKLNNKIFVLDSEKEMLRKETIEWEEDCKRAYNIIAELEKWLEEEIDKCKTYGDYNEAEIKYEVMCQLKELKENSK